MDAVLYSILMEKVYFVVGEHPTTKLCLKMIRALDYNFFQSAHVMDYGTGSGVLALTALKLGNSLQLISGLVLA